jgi:hypothetical protein
MIRKRNAVWIVAVLGGVLAAILIPLAVRRYRPVWTTIQGAVMREDTDARKELPIAGVQVTASHGTESLRTESDPSGYFRIEFPGVIWPGQTLELSFRQTDYQPLDMTIPIRFRSMTRQLLIAAMSPLPVRANVNSTAAQIRVANVKVRYTVNSQSAANVGSAVKVFQVVNHGNIPCNRHAPCSPDGYWKASSGSAVLDAGPGNEFRDARASCIAGPCPFTRIDSSGFREGGRVITASALDWSDTATFLFEAEVFHVGIASDVRPTMIGYISRTSEAIPT